MQKLVKIPILSCSERKNLEKCLHSDICINSLYIFENTLL